MDSKMYLTLGFYSVFLFFAAAAQAQCNGHVELCDRIYSNVSQVGSHDSAFVGNLPTQNQHLSVADQLNAGIRFLQAQTHSFGGSIEMCHTSCFEENSGSLSDYLTAIKGWLAASSNGKEVLTLLLVNGDSLPVSQFGDVFHSVGLDAFAFIPSKISGIGDWPTLQNLIDDGTRLVVFMDTKADTSAVPYILDEFTYFFETPYDTTDPSFPECSLDRPAGSSAAGKMYIVNHFLDLDIFGIDIPDEAAAATTNSESSIGSQVGICIGSYGHEPKGVLLDYVDLGDPSAAEKDMNGLAGDSVKSIACV